MKPSLVLLYALCASPLFADAGSHIIPAGSLVGCTISEPKLSSKTAAVGDPVLCQVSRAERYGRTVLPYNSFLVGRFEDYKDPGHFVGKGWMELKFDRMVIEPDTDIAVSARVVDAPGYKVDNKGRIIGKGHEARDIAMWSIPILWPVDLLMLPMRGPRPTLKQETRLTLKVMDDIEIPATQEPQQDGNGLMRRPSAENEAPPPMQEDQAPQPEVAQAPPPQQYPYAYAVPPPPPPMYYGPMVVAPPLPVYGYAPGGYAYGPRLYGYRPAVRPYGYGRAPYAYPRVGVGGPRGYAYGGARPGMTARAGMGGGARGGLRR